MSLIYTPKGKAHEYAGRALNLFNGCEHGCTYCFCTRFYKNAFYEAANPKRQILERLKREVVKLDPAITPEILISFQGDPYQPAEMKLRLTRQVLEILIAHNLPFTILTKGGTRACRDFDLLEKYPKARFGTSLVFYDQKLVNQWEPNAASVVDRIEAIKEAHQHGIKTWLSLEPVIVPTEAYKIIENLHSVVDHWKVGKINYNKEVESRVDWIAFREEVKTMLERYGCDYYLKKSLTEL